MCVYCEQGSMNLCLIELGEVTNNKHEYSYIKLENGKLVFRTTNAKKGTYTDIGRKAKFCIECGRKLTED